MAFVDEKAQARVKAALDGLCEPEKGFLYTYGSCTGDRYGQLRDFSTRVRTLVNGINPPGKLESDLNHARQDLQQARWVIVIHLCHSSCGTQDLYFFTRALRRASDSCYLLLYY